MAADFVALSLVPMLAAVLAALATALPGNLLILRGEAMVGDMMAHAALPGIVAAFLVTGSTSGLAMTLGAMAAALLSVGMVQAIRAAGPVPAPAAMAMTFTTLFAAGVLMLELTGAGGVHLDVEHALYGSLESLIWLDATGWGALLDPAALAGLPPELFHLAAALGLVAATLAMAWRPLVMASFDPVHAATQGLPVRGLSLLLVAVTAVASVAAFAAVGAILTIAMLILPAATARLLTDRLPRQVALSAVIAATTALAGTVLAGWGPLALGHHAAVSASGMIAVTGGVGLGLAALRRA
ncbi:MAG: metal ABC transporter permease [Paracoccaceae bacterium]|nr:MAG: metal ABC transporter permease [Paracoccaceae bacterium]